MCSRYSARFCFPVSDQFAQSSFLLISRVLSVGVFIVNPILRVVPLFSSSKLFPRATVFRGWCRSTVLAYSRRDKQRFRPGFLREGRLSEESPF
ncbi:hypothetical protein DEO72_LG9g919 [Vigna unguiculata]|uniref:Uncharacterized protein n=1 Tax=Vigna unguiculata TaxID=3917 RepID=A0A4D6MWM6_VIGUN|nr:hypothetical protein DEO72_LG9g919 [Vigna unguiculata]